MHFYIDESGNTGNNLFDESQPIISYGVLSTKSNIDIIGRNIYNKILQITQSESMHANELGINKIIKIIPLLYQLHEKMSFNFDYYFVDKKFFALIAFFEAVFDAGSNKGVKWEWYWTPLRFIIILDLLNWLDDELLKASWNLCIDNNINTKKREITNLLKEVKKRIEITPLQQRHKEVLIDALSYGISHPLNLDFGTTHKNLLSPNNICFQFVCIGIAKRLRMNNITDATEIIIDQQSQFNSIHKFTSEFFKNISEARSKLNNEEKLLHLNNPLYRHLKPEDIMLEGMPSKQISISSSNKSKGLQITDLYLWITNRIIKEKAADKELTNFINKASTNIIIDGISSQTVLSSWVNFEKELPQI